MRSPNLVSGLRFGSPNLLKAGNFAHLSVDFRKLVSKAFENLNFNKDSRDESDRNYDTSTFMIFQAVHIFKDGR